MAKYTDLAGELGEGTPTYPQEPSGMTLSVAEVTDLQNEPVGLQEAKAFLRLDTLHDATVLATVIQAARSTAEKHLGRLLVQREVTLTYEDFRGAATLPYPPIASLTDVEVKGGGSFSSVDSGNYHLDGRRLTVDGLSVGAVARITYEAGYSPVPPGLKLQLLQDIRAAYDHRDPLEGASLSGDIITHEAYQKWRVR